MRHQIISLREVWNERKEIHDISDNKHFGKWEAATFEELLTIASKIPKAERYNFFYTVAKCTEKKREFGLQDILMFDIDKLSSTDPANLDALTKVVTKTLGVSAENIIVICSGNGLHFAIKLKTPITESVYFDKMRPYYKAICMRIDAAIRGAGLQGKADPAVFDARRIMRLPGTENRKPGKEPAACYAITTNLVPQDFGLMTVAGIPKVSASEQVVMDVKIPTDGKAVCDGCNFLKWMKEKPSEVSESEWYAGLSILGRIDRKLAHEYSKPDPRYSFEETESKIDQALEASGPRTCLNINKLWGKCVNCPNWQKVTSPIMIRGEDFIATEKTGFHSITTDANGNPKLGKPNYEDLRRFFQREAPYRTVDERCYRYNGKFWEYYKIGSLRAFAQKYFKPTANTKMTTEFQGIVQRTNLIDGEWFNDSIKNCINFSNGVLDLKSLEFKKHDSGFGFQYVLPYDYDPTARCPQFEKFMGDVFENNDDLIAMVLEYLGYMFSGAECWAQKAMVFTGEGANGKSTLIDVIHALAGKKNYSSLTMSDLQSPVQRFSLVGKLFNISEETPSQSLQDSSMFKALVSGGTIRVKELYHQPHDYKNFAKLLFACNRIPPTKDFSKGYLRRFLIVPFNVEFKDGDGKKDPFIGEKLLAELPGIFNLVVKHYITLLKNRRFTKAVAADAATEEYQLEINNVRRWFEECVELTESEDVQDGRKLYSLYAIYSESMGEKPETAMSFFKTLRVLAPDRYKRTTRMRGYQGFKILKDDSK